MNTVTVTFNTLAAGYEYIVPGNQTKIKHISVVLPTT